MPAFEPFLKPYSMTRSSKHYSIFSVDISHPGCFQRLTYHTFTFSSFSSPHCGRVSARNAADCMANPQQRAACTLQADVCQHRLALHFLCIMQVLEIKGHACSMQEQQNDRVSCEIAMHANASLKYKHAIQISTAENDKHKCSGCADAQPSTPITAISKAISHNSAGSTALTSKPILHPLQWSHVTAGNTLRSAAL